MDRGSVPRALTKEMMGAPIPTRALSPYPLSSVLGIPGLLPTWTTGVRMDTGNALLAALAQPYPNTRLTSPPVGPIGH